MLRNETDAMNYDPVPKVDGMGVVDIVNFDIVIRDIAWSSRWHVYRKPACWGASAWMPLGVWQKVCCGVHIQTIPIPFLWSSLSFASLGIHSKYMQVTKTAPRRMYRCCSIVWQQSVLRSSAYPGHTWGLVCKLHNRYMLYSCTSCKNILRHRFDRAHKKKQVYIYMFIRVHIFLYIYIHIHMLAVARVVKMTSLTT